MKKKTNLKEEKKSKLTLDDFKKKSNLSESNDALDAITGGILGAGADAPTPSPSSNYDGDKKPTGDPD